MGEPVADKDLVKLAATLCVEGADGRAGLRALLRSVEDRWPGEIERMTSSLQLQKARLRPPGS